MKSLHPETIEVEHFNGNISSFHPFEERVNCLFIIIGRETGGKPEPEAPTRDLPRFSSQNRILLKYVLGRGSMNDVPDTGSAQY